MDKTIWHLKDKRHYIVDSETPSYYFLRVGGKDANTVKRVHKKFCVDLKPKNSYTITVVFNINVLDYAVTVQTHRSIEILRDDLFAELNDTTRSFIMFHNDMFRKSDIHSVSVDHAKS